MIITDTNVAEAAQASKTAGAPIIADGGTHSYRFATNESIESSSDFGRIYGQLELCVEILAKGTDAWSKVGLFGREAVEAYKKVELEELNWAYVMMQELRHHSHFVKDVMKLIDTYGSNNRSIHHYNGEAARKLMVELQAHMRGLLVVGEQVNRDAKIIESTAVKARAVKAAGV